MRITRASLAPLLAVLAFLPCLNAMGYKAAPSKELSPEATVKLEELKKNADLLGVIKLWEEEGGYNEWKINGTFTQALLSFPREIFVPAMLEGMKSKKDFVAHSCLDILSRLKEKAALEYLVSLAIVPPLTEDQKKAAAQLAEDLANKDAKVSDAATAELLEMGPAVIDIVFPLIDKYRVMQEYPASQKALQIVQTLQGIFSSPEINALSCYDDDVALKILRTIIKGGNHRFPPYMEEGAIWALGDHVTADDAEILRPYLKARWPSHEVIQKLGKLKDKESIPALLTLLGDGELGDYKSEIVDALGNIGDKRAVKPLEDMLSEEQQNDRKGVYVAALAQLGEKKYLHDALENYSVAWDSQTILVQGLKISNKEEVDILLKRLNNGTDINFAIITIGILAQIPAACGDARVIEAIQKAFQMMESKGYKYQPGNGAFSMSLLLLEYLDEENAISALAKDKDPATRYSALSYIAAARNTKFLPMLVEACDDKTIFKPRYPVHRGQGGGDEQILTELQVREPAIQGVIQISGQPFDLWDFDRDRQVKEIKAWYAKYLEQKAK